MKEVIKQAKMVDADRLVSIACLKQGEGFAIYYHLSNDKDPELREIRVDVGREEEVESLAPLYANAELFEIEATELYGVKFAGNPSNGKRLFLEER